MRCVGRQNAWLKVRFDKIFASFSSIGKGRASPAVGQKAKNETPSGRTIEYVFLMQTPFRPKQISGLNTITYGRI